MPPIKSRSQEGWLVKANYPFTEQAHLLVSLLPSVAKQRCFALKGGTAINLFLRDVPRL
jgi:hypothetical protein